MNIHRCMLFCLFIILLDKSIDASECVLDDQEHVVDEFEGGTRPVKVIRTRGDQSGVTFQVPKTWTGRSVMNSTLHIAGVYSPVGKEYDRIQLRKTIAFEVQDIEEYCRSRGIDLNVERVEVRLKGPNVSHIQVFMTQAEY